MTQPPEGGGRTVLSVTDFGPIAKAAVELRPLTILAGPSNTGKSHLAMLVYALSKCFSRSYPDDTGRRFGHHSPGRRGRSLRGERAAEELWKDIPREGKAMFATWLTKSKAHLRGEEKLTYPAFLQGMLRDAYGSSLGSGQEIGNELERCFGISGVGDLTRRGSRGPAVANVSFFNGSDARQANFDLRLGASGTFGRGAVSPEFPVAVSKSGRGVLRHLGRDRDISGEEFSLRSFCEVYGASRAPHIDLASPAHFFPADRGGIMRSHRAVAGSLARDALRDGVPTPALSGVVGDFLKGLMDMGDREGPFSRHGRSIESGILGGEIHVERP